MGVLALAIVVLVCGIFNVPLFGRASPLIRTTAFLRSRDGSDFDLEIRGPNTSYRIDIHPKGRFTGYPGNIRLALRLTLPDMPAINAEQDIEPISEPVQANGVTDYVFDPIYFQFTAPTRGPAHLWMGYGSGPEGKVSIVVSRR